MAIVQLVNTNAGTPGKRGIHKKCSRQDLERTALDILTMEEDADFNEMLERVEESTDEELIELIKKNQEPEMPSGINLSDETLRQIENLKNNASIAEYFLAEEDEDRTDKTLYKGGDYATAVRFFPIKEDNKMLGIVYRVPYF